MPATRFADVLQLVDLKRHATTELHVQSLTFGSAEPSSAHASPAATAPTPAQVRLAIEVAKQPRAGQGVGYASRCELAGRADPMNYPMARSSQTEHARIMQAIAAVLREEARTGASLASRWPNIVARIVPSLLEPELPDGLRRHCVRMLSSWF